MYEDLKIDGLPAKYKARVQRALTAAYQMGRADGAAEKTEQFDQQLKPVTSLVSMMISSLAPIGDDQVQTDIPIEAIDGLPWLALHFLKRGGIASAEQLRQTPVSRLLALGVDQGSIPRINQALHKAGFPTTNDN